MRIFIFENGLKKAPTEYSRYLIYPYSAEHSHDTALGAASVTLRNMEREETFAPGTVVMIGDGYWTDNTLDQWVIVDTARSTNHANRKHTHTLYLCDITKLLEREVIGNKTFTRSMVRGDDFKQIKATAMILDTADGYVGNNYSGDSMYVARPSVFTPIDTIENTIPMASFASVFPNLGDHPRWLGDTYKMAVLLNGKVIFETKFDVIYDAEISDTGEVTTTTSGTTTVAEMELSQWNSVVNAIKLNEGGTVEYQWVYSSPDDMKNIRTVVLFGYVNATDNGIPKQISLLSACNIVGEIAREGRSADKLHIRPIGEQATRAMAAEIVDVDLSGATLRESIDTLAGVGGCFCRYRLEYDTDAGAFTHYADIYPISSREVADTSQLGTPVLQKMADSIEGACSAMDSTVSNLVCAGDSGTMCEPTDKAWMSLRSEEVRVTESTAEVQVANPIYRVEKLEVAYEDHSADITKYLFEKTEYDLLSSYAPAYPRSKSYALYYQRGQNSIGGLSFEIEHALSQLFASPSIVNICNAEFGTSFDDLGFEALGSSGILEYPKLRFRVTYIPIVNTRAKQTKPDAADNAAPNTIIYNQSASYTDANRYGRNMAGAAERAGQPGKTVSYKAKAGSTLPMPGTLYPPDPDYTISKVTVQRGKDVQTVQLDLARRFNRLNPFIGIDSTPRLFEISEHQFIDRNVVYEDYCIIGDAADGGSASLITAAGVQGFADALVITSATGDDTPAIAVAMGMTEGGTALTKCLLPISSFGLGRSLTFTFGYKDNYSAGDKVSVTNAAGALYSLKEAVPYANVFGEFKRLILRIYAKQGTAGIDPDKLPEHHDGAISGGKLLFDTEEAAGLVIYKDSRECIKLTYQIHFVTNKDWIISPGMAEDFRMITRKSSVLTKQVRLYRLDYELSRVDTTIDLTRATAESFTTRSGSLPGIPLEVDTDSKRVQIDSTVFGTYREYNHFTGSGKAWAVAYEDGKLLFGSNESITALMAYPNINFTFRHTTE